MENAAPTPEIVNVVDPDTQEVGSIPSHQLADAVSQGYAPASNEQVQKYLNQLKFSTPGQQAITAVEGLGEGLAGPLFTAGEKALGAKGENILGRREENPWIHGLTQGAGLVGGSLLGTGEAKALEIAGEGAQKLIGLGGEGAGALSKIGGAASKAAVENALFQAGDETSQLIANPSLSLDTAAANIGLAGLIGAPLGAGLGAISPLWKAASGSQMGQFLKILSDRAGGIEGVVPDTLRDAIHTSGLDVAPEIRAGLSDNPEIQQMFKTLEQSDTTKSGLELQNTYNNFRKDIGNNVLQSFGKTESDLSAMENLSKYESGKNLGSTLAEEMAKKIDPLAEKFEALKDKYKDVGLIEDRRAYRMDENPYLSAEQRELNRTVTDLIPGTSTKIADDIAQLVQREGWYSSPSSDIMKEVNRVIEETKNLKTLKDLSNYQTQIGANTYDFTNPQLSRAGQMMKGILRDAESDLVTSQLGKEAPHLVAEHSNLRSAWKAASDLKDSLDSRLHVGGGNSPKAFIKSLREMAQTDGEKVLNRLSGKNSAEVLGLLKKQFPQTAQALREFHINELLKNAASKAAPGETINVQNLLNSVNKMSPELRNFVMTPDLIKKIEAVSTVVDQFKKVPHNFSNSARTMDKLSQYLPGSAIGLATLLTGHNPMASLLIGSLVKPLGKDVPDAIRLGLLKFLGSNKPIDSVGFKSMIEMIDHTIKGENLISKATKSIFKAGQQVLPQALIPSEKDRVKLKKILATYQENPDKMFEIGGSTAHYLPDHGQALGEKAASAVNYLNSLKPSTAKANPLDGDVKPSKVAEGAYNNALNIAEQPLIVLEHISKGTLTPEDLVHLDHLYPGLHQRMIQKLTAEVANTMSKGEIIPYKVRLGMSMLMGQPLDSTMTPQAIQATQPQAQPMPQPEARAKHSMTALNKMSAMDMTPQQSREASRLKH